MPEGNPNAVRDACNDLRVRSRETYKKVAAVGALLLIITGGVIQSSCIGVDHDATATASALETSDAAMGQAVATAMPTIVRRSTKVRSFELTSSVLATRVEGWNRGLALGTPLPPEALTPIPTFDWSD